MGKFPIVRVTWRDASDLQGWVTSLPERLAKADEPVESVGFLVEETDTHIVIALNHVMGEDTIKGDDAVPWGQLTIIPAGAIVKKTVLRGMRG